MKRALIFAALILTLAVNGQAFAATTASKKVTPAPALVATAQVTTPSDIIKNFYAQLLDTMKQGDQLGFGGRFKKLEPTIKSAFDLPLMTRFAVGSVWAKATPDEQQQLISAFSDFSVANYASQFKKFDGEQFDVIDEKPSNNGVIVETKLTPKGAEPVALNYMMRKDDKGNYRIVDVYLDGSISQLAMRRSEFSSIVNSDGIPALVNSLGAKSKEMGPS